MSRDGMFRCACCNTDRIITSSFDVCIQRASRTSATTPIHVEDSIFIYQLFEFDKFHLCDREK
ncbi:hypothetical protein BURCENBC7_AP5382 [Burkholderia cenocepacia BC7]|nr:hypothetical protein BURCENBC7_AP5382 [Burkholderia cenocepacia BC7]